MIGEVPLHTFGCFFGYAFIIAEEVAGRDAVIDFVELVDVIGEFSIGILFLDSLAVCIVPVLFYKGIIGRVTDFT